MVISLYCFNVFLCMCTFFFLLSAVFSLTSYYKCRKQKKKLEFKLQITSFILSLLFNIEVNSVKMNVCWVKVLKSIKKSCKDERKITVSIFIYYNWNRNLLTNLILGFLFAITAQSWKKIKKTVINKQKKKKCSPPFYFLSLSFCVFHPSASTTPPIFPYVHISSSFVHSLRFFFSW